jgi:large subunit ribosomal protein L22
MITHARLMHLGVPALKVRRFASTIKGEKAERALAILDLQPSPTCQKLSKLLRSAIANAVNNHQLSADYLVVSNVLVDQGPTMKRIRPRARGRAYRVLKRSSHVTIELDLAPGQELAEVAGGDEASKKARDRGRKKAEAAPAEKKEDKSAVKAKPKAKSTTTKKPARSTSAKPKATKSEKQEPTKKAGAKTSKKAKEDKE